MSRKSAEVVVEADGAVKVTVPGPIAGSLVYLRRNQYGAYSVHITHSARGRYTSLAWLAGEEARVHISAADHVDFWIDHACVDLRDAEDGRAIAAAFGLPLEEPAAKAAA